MIVNIFIFCIIIVIVFYKNRFLKIYYMEENKIKIKIADSFEQEKKQVKKANWFEIISRAFLLSGIFLLTLFFIPSNLVHFEFGKILTIAVVAMASLVFWCLSGIKNRKLEISANFFSLSSFFIILAFLLSSVFSGNKINSLIGHGFELGTFGSVFIGFILMFSAASFFRTKDEIFYSYAVLFVSFCFIFLFQTARLLLGADFLSFGILKNITFNTIGKWNDLSVYFGLIALLSIITLHLVKLRGPMKIFLFFASMASFFFISLINFKIVWFAGGSFALVFCIYLISARRGGSGDVNAVGLLLKSKITPYLALFFLALSVVFIVDGFRSKPTIGNSIAGYFKISQFEVRPSFKGTSEVMKSALKENPVFGLGPNRFVNGWLLFKPEGVNNTVFWNYDFIYGVGLVPTFMITTGISGIVSWISFLGLFLYAGFKYIYKKTSDPFSHYLIISSFVASLYLWIINFFYVPSAVIFFLSFFFTGLFIGSLAKENLIPIKKISCFGSPGRNLASIFALVAVAVFSFAGVYVYASKFASNIYFQKSINLFGVDGNVDEALKYASKAVHLSKDDYYYRAISDIHLARLNNLSLQKNLSKEDLSEQFKSIIQSAIQASKDAIGYDNANYQNYLTAGRMYESIIPFEGAYKLARDNYNAALVLNPESPLITLMLARLEIINKDNAKAREYIEKSILLKNNYTDAVFLLAQIEIAEGNIKNAIKLVEAGSVLDFDNPVVYFQLGILKYSDNEKDYKGATEAFEKAISLNSSYSNARYFLGLSYYNLGKKSESIKQFELVQELNPDNKEVELILKNLKDGKAPFANALPPVDDKPEKRKELPVKEDEAGLTEKM